VQTLIIAHRTLPKDAAENSLAGIAKAAELGADGVEIDLRMSLDQKPLLLHDWTLRRTTGFPLPLELTPDFIAHRLHLIAGEEHLPSLQEALDALPLGLLLAVDVKTPWAVIPLVQEIRKRRLEARTLIWCTSAIAVRYAARALPSVEVAYLKDVTDHEGKRRFIEKAKRLGAKAVSAHWRAIDAAFVAAAHGLGLRVYSYHGGHIMTPDKLSAGLDGLITDFPVEAREALTKLGLAGR
jgi:glycerophosphoryl diester phosphodiesterase